MTRIVKGLEHPHRKIKCSLSDHFAFRIPVPVAFFYRNQIPSDLLINALKHVLRDFPIFSGVLVKEEQHLYIDCCNQGVQVNIVHSEKSLCDQLSHFQTLDTLTFVDMLNPYKALKKRNPLLTIKLSYFPDGMVLGFCWHHSLGDMATFMEFLKALSSYAREEDYPLPLILENRDEFLTHCEKEERGLSKSSFKCMKYSDILKFIKLAMMPKKGLYFYFSHEEIEKLRSTIRTQSGFQLTRNSALCAYLLECLAQCRVDSDTTHYASFIINYRSRVGVSSNLLGNFIDAVTLQYPQVSSCMELAKMFHDATQNYLEEYFSPSTAQNFVQVNGGIKNIGKIIPTAMLPQYKNLIISNWSNYSVYSIDFGIEKPFLFLPVGKSPIPWVSCIVEGFENRGLFLSLVLPSRLADRLTHPDKLAQIHQYRSQSLPDEIKRYDFY